MKERIINFVRSQIKKNRDLILNEAKYLDGFMDLLMKQRNTGEKWTFRERMQLKNDIKRLVGYVPILSIFLLPAGFLLIPIMAEVMDRRKRSRRTKTDDLNRMGGGGDP
jgi:hypothetical protein